jgi:hypothetical protein
MPNAGSVLYAVGAFDGYRGGVAQQYKVCALATIFPSTHYASRRWSLMVVVRFVEHDFWSRMLA